MWYQNCKLAVSFRHEVTVPGVRANESRQFVAGWHQLSVGYTFARGQTSAIEPLVFQSVGCNIRD